MFRLGMAAAIAATVMMLWPMGCVRQRLQRRQARFEQKVEVLADEVDLGNSPQANFSRAATRANNAAIDMSYLAWLKGHSPAVRRFASTTLGDHTDLNTQLGAVNSGPLKIPLTIWTNLQDTQRLEELEALSGPEFDRAYMRAIITNGELALDLYRFEASAGVDPGLREYAARAVPVLATQVEAARFLASTLEEKPEETTDRKGW